MPARTWFVRSFCVGAAMAASPPAPAATYVYEWPSTTTPSAEIAPFKFGKDFAYAIEIDDNPVTAFTVAAPLLARHAFTDAPPGVSGGKSMPFVGTTALIVGTIGTRNTRNLQWDQLRQLKENGWGVVNHSYSHVGRSYGSPPEILTKEQIARELFWSEAVLAEETGGAPSHFVYPNGYVAYGEHLAAFGFISGSRAFGSGSRMIYSEKAKPLDMNRNYLDEGPWAKAGDVMHGFGAKSVGAPQPGEFVIDFTHGISEDAQSDNFKRWTQRLSTIAERHGRGGKDDLWCAPSGEIAQYAAARKAAKIDVAAGRVTLTLPDGAPGAALTVKLSGLTETDVLVSPPGGTLHRQGDTAWVTTPHTGHAGAVLPGPRVKRLYAGAIKPMTWDQPVAIAAVRLRQDSPPKTPAALSVIVKTASGSTEQLVADDQKAIGKAWGKWLLIDVVPNRPAIEVTALDVKGDACLSEMEVWVAAE